MSKSQVLAALSRALDLVEGQPEGHAERTAVIALGIARQLGLSQAERENLAYAALLKDSGCSNNAVRIQKIFGGDEHLAKRAVKEIDWSSPIESIKFAWQHTEVGQSLGRKLRRMAANIGPPNKVMNEVTEARCTRGAEIARMLSFSPDVAETILYLDEHWNGKGAPYGKRKDEIPLLSRILGLAQSLEVFVTGYGIDEALAMAEARSGTWFDPDTVLACRILCHQSEFWDGLHEPDWLSRELPHLQTEAMDSDIDAICEAFAMIIDAKSSFTSEHSTRVMTYSVALGRQLGFSPMRLQHLRRAALLHDIGKLGVPTGVLEKPGKLDDAEFAKIKLHPELGEAILGRIPGFEYAAEIAGRHHERLDGRGYWRGLQADQLSVDVRVVTVCDVFDALSADRPYRDALPMEKVWEIMEGDRGRAFDPECLDALRSWTDGDSLARAA